MKNMKYATVATVAGSEMMRGAAAAAPFPTAESLCPDRPSAWTQWTNPSWSQRGQHLGEIKRDEAHDSGIVYIYIYIIIYPMISNYIRGLKAPAITSQNVMMLCFCWNEPLDCLDHVDPLDSRPCLDRLGHLDPRDLKKGPIAVSSHIFSVSKPVPWATCPLQMIHET